MVTCRLNVNSIFLGGGDCQGGVLHTHTVHKSQSSHPPEKFPYETLLLLPLPLLQPYAWESREHLRKLVVGKEVMFAVEYKVQTSGREYGFVWVNVDGQTVNATDSMISSGLAEVRQGGRQSE